MSNIETAKELHKRHSRITFKVVKETDSEIVIRVEQGKNPQDIYQTAERLIAIGKQVYADCGKTILVHPCPYVLPPAYIVTPEWIQKQMLQHKIRSKQLAEAFGLTKEDISGLVNGHKEMGIRTKGLFFYYFKSIRELK
jgi:hypothetical protein